MAPEPQLLDEIIGTIFSYLIPKSSGINREENIDYRTLKTCCLVSKQFAFWGRRGLYKRVHLGSPEQIAHYVSLFKRYRDMPTHIRTLEVTLPLHKWPEGDPATGKGQNDLAWLLDLLAQKGSVDRCHFCFLRPWDQLKTSLQVSVLRFILSKPFEVVEIGGICLCFPLNSLPIPWVARRFHVGTVHLALAEDDGEAYFSCPDWEKEKMQLASWTRQREVKTELRDVILECRGRLDSAGFLHPEKTKLQSLWICSKDVATFEVHLNKPISRPCIHALRELQFTYIFDETVPEVARLIQGCQHTLESLCLYDLQVQSATSSHLSLLTSIHLPRLHTLTIITTMEPTIMPTKSMAWYLLHARKNQKVSRNAIKSINLVFLGSTEFAYELTLAGTTRNHVLINQLFNMFKFFKLDQVILDILAPAPDAGKLKLWFLMGSSPGRILEAVIEESIEKEFPTLLKEDRVTSSLGMCDEYFMVVDALSISPDLPARTRHQIWETEEEQGFNV